MPTKLKLNEVEIRDSLFSSRSMLTMEYIREFPIKRLLHTFYLQAGIPSVAEPLGGWEEEECGLRGHFTGHFLSACSKFSAGYQDRELKEKVLYIVNELEKCATKEGYLSAFPESALDTLEKDEDHGVWAPYYTLHKIMQGLIDTWQYVGSKTALKLAKNLAYYVKGRFDRLSFWKIDGILRCTKLNPVNEFGGMGDALYTLYGILKEEWILELALTFDREYFLGNLEQNKDILTDLHSNTHLPMVLAAVHRYRITGETRYRIVAEHFYKYLKGRTYANGNSSGPAEHCVEGQVSQKAEHWCEFEVLDDSLTDGESESCCAHNTERMLEYMFGWEEESSFLEHMEILKYNAVLNSTSSKTGLSQYHQPLGIRCQKIFSDKYQTFWCCTASGVEAMSEIQRNLYYYIKKGLLVNFYITSRVKTEDGKWELEQQTNYPNETQTQLYLKKVPEDTGILYFRSKGTGKILINNKECRRKERHAYVEVAGIHTGDLLEVELVPILHLQPLPGSRERVALMYGNILLAQLGPYVWLEEMGERTLEQMDETWLNQMLIRTHAKQLKFAWKSRPEVQFIPLYEVEDEEYSVYLFCHQAIQTQVKGNIEYGQSAYE